MKTVNRKYYSKKTGTWITKTYQYESKKYRFSKAITKTGKIGKTFERRLIEAYAKTPGEAADILRYAKVKTVEGYKNWSDERILASFYHDRISGMFANAGYTVKEAAKMINVDPDYILDKNNWDGDELTLPNGSKYMFKFNYDGAIWEKL